MEKRRKITVSSEVSTLQAKICKEEFINNGSIGEVTDGEGGRSVADQPRLDGEKEDERGMDDASLQREDAANQQSICDASLADATATNENLPLAKPPSQKKSHKKSPAVGGIPSNKADVNQGGKEARASLHVPARIPQVEAPKKLTGSSTDQDRVVTDALTVDGTKMHWVDWSQNLVLALSSQEHKKIGGITVTPLATRVNVAPIVSSDSTVTGGQLTKSFVVIGGQGLQSLDANRVIIIPKSQLVTSVITSSGVKKAVPLRRLVAAKDVRAHNQKFHQLLDVIIQMKMDLRPACTDNHMALERLKRKIHIALTLLNECRKSLHKFEQSNTSRPLPNLQSK